MVEMLIGGGLAAVGMLLGRFIPGRRRGPRIKTRKPICGCEHDLAHHEPDGGGGGTRCSKLVRGAATNWDEDGFANGWDMVQCSCRQYTGPRIIDPGYVARELSDGNRG